MADETAYIAPSSLIEHCHMLGAQHNPSNFSSSVPGGVWGAAPKERRTPEAGHDKEDPGVPIFRVDHQMNGDGMIFTPVDGSSLLNREGRTSTGSGMPMTVPESEEEYTASQSLSDFCKDLGMRHDPTQFGTSVPGGCWATSVERAGGPPALLGSSVDKESSKTGGIPIHRVEHKMNGDGMIFTPSQSTMHSAMVVGSVESDSDISWRGASPSAASPALNLFDQPRLRNTGLILPPGSPPGFPPSAAQQAGSGPTTLAEALKPHVEEVEPEDPLGRITEEDLHGPPSPKPNSKASSPASSPKVSPKLGPAVGELQTVEGSPDSSTGSGSSALAPRSHQHWGAVNKIKVGEEVTCRAKPKCSIM